jgi:hypothetical protein
MNVKPPAVAKRNNNPFAAAINANNRLILQQGGQIYTGRGNYISPVDAHFADGFADYAGP